jgi:hypothetical protein
MDTAVKLPLSQRINFRLIAFLSIPVLLFGWFLYVYLDQTLTGGIANHGDYVEVKELKAMGNFLFDDLTGTDEDIPQQYRALNGKRVLLTGQLYPEQSAGPEVKRFQLVYNIGQCCFNGPPRVQERVFVLVPDHLRVANVYDQRIRVYGKLDVACRRDPESGKVVAIYRMVADKVEPV